MSNLQKFSDLLGELETDVTALEKRQAASTAEIKQLDGRKQFLESKITELEELKADSKAAFDLKTADRKAKLAELDAQLTDATTELTQLQSKQDLARTDLEMVKKTGDDQIQTIQNTADDKKQQIITLNDEIKHQEDTLAGVKTAIIAANNELTALDAEKTAKAAAIAEEIAQMERDTVIIRQQFKALGQTLDKRQDDLEAVETKVTAASEKLVELDKENREFADYQVRATAALEAREQSIIEREERIVDAEQRAKRRGILDNV